MNYVLKVFGIIFSSFVMFGFSIFLLIVALMLRGAYAWLFEGYTLPTF